METMDDYKEELEATFKKIHVGDVVTGTVIDVTEDAVLVDLKTYADGIIRKEDLSEDPDFNMEEAVYPVQKGCQCRPCVGEVKKPHGRENRRDRKDQ